MTHFQLFHSKSRSEVYASPINNRLITAGEYYHGWCYRSLVGFPNVIIPQGEYLYSTGVTRVIFRFLRFGYENDKDYYSSIQYKQPVIRHDENVSHLARNASKQKITCYKLTVSESYNQFLSHNRPNTGTPPPANERTSEATQRTQASLRGNRKIACA